MHVVNLGNLSVDTALASAQCASYLKGKLDGMAHSSWQNDDFASISPHTNINVIDVRIFRFLHFLCLQSLCEPAAYIH